MSTDRAKTQQQIFADMHRELRAWNAKIPDSPDRLDPILKILLQLYSHELARIDGRVSDLWERATNSIIRSLNPECKRWPVPAYTVMKCDITDPVVEIDPHTRFFYREEREGGQTFFFSPLKVERLVNASVKRVYYRDGDRVVDLTPAEDGFDAVAGTEASTDSSSAGQIYLGVAYDGRATDLARSRLFMKSHENALKQLRWAHWYPSSASGTFYDDSGFCPGLTSTIDDIVRQSDDDDDWGGLRSGESLFGQLENSFVVFPETFAQTWEPSPLPSELADRLTANRLALPADDSQLYWIRADLPSGGPRSGLVAPVEACFDACVVVNRNELTLFKHTGGNQLMEIEIPESIEAILGVTSVTDASARSYLPRHLIHTNMSAGTYLPEERGDRLTLWFDFSSVRDLPPDSVTVTYAVTAGIAANGIGIGKITDLYESHPGISGGRNLLPTGGAIPARTEPQIVEEVAARLRGRDRALTFQEIARWAMSFDPRIKKARCEDGVERISTGVRRCVVVRLALDHDGFCSSDETALLRRRLKSFLKSRAPVNTHFQVETPGV